MAKAGGGGGGSSRFRSSTVGGNITKVSSSIDGVDPFIQVSYKVPGAGGETVTETTTISGATSQTMTISCNVVKTQTVSVTVDGGSIPTIPTTVTSDTANFYSISQSNLQQSEVVLQIIDDEDGTQSSSTTNLFLQSLNLIPTTTTSDRSFVIHSGRNIPVRITLDGAGGASTANATGGSGGRTIFDYTLLANTEYVFKLGVQSGNVQGGPAAYFYEKGTLLVVSGGGGSAGSTGNGGNGSGAGLAGVKGIKGGGNSSGAGGEGIVSGTLPGTGVLPSGTTGGRVESCTSGYYWATQGKSPCEELGTVKFRTAGGNEVSASVDTITRGFKADFSYANSGKFGFRKNGGSSTFGNGGGGSGVVGGNATSNGIGGGGGGSGYTNGAVTIVSTGTSPEGAGGVARAIIELRT